MTNLSFLIKNRHEILGLNDRSYNFQFFNTGHRKIADDKILTKKVLSSASIPTPAVYAIIKSRKELDNFDFESLPKSFVLKPARGFKGAGINIYYNRSKDGNWILADKKKHGIDDIKSHIIDILDGQFSFGLDPKPSYAIFEERIKMHNTFKYYSYRGIPDIRVIVYNQIPVMAMLRLPTEESEGKANINRGAIGVGIDMTNGITTTAIKNGKTIELLPETKIRLSGIRIPFWTKILRIAYMCGEQSGLKFFGVDIIIDKEKGPMVIELNARPGLGIQVANQAGLKERLLRVKKLKNIREDRAVRLAKDLFGGEIEEEIENLSGREVIGLEEEVTFTDKEGKEIKTKCKIDTGADSSSIDRELARQLGYGDVVDFCDKILDADVAEKEKVERKAYEKILCEHQDILNTTRVKTASGLDYRVKIEIPARLKERQFTMKATIADRSQLQYQVILGRKDLKNFLIDITRTKYAK